MALYRKYRPATFADVVGQEHVTVPLSRALDAERINHAYLFSGPRGCGKTSSARILARSLNCVHGPTSTPCGECESCRALAPGGPGSLDVTELDAASHRGVEDMRDLRDRAIYAPAESRYRVFIIDEAHMITKEGFNALLKIVEEPPEHLVFIFATTEPEKVLTTIKSRTHQYPFRLLAPNDMRGLLERICHEEKVQVEDSVYPLVIRAGGGSPRDSLSVLDQLLAGADENGITYAHAAGVLGITDSALIDAAVESVANNDPAGLFTTINDVLDAGHDPRRFATDLVDRFRDLLVLQSIPDAFDQGLVDAPLDQRETLADEAQSLGPATLTRCAAVVSDGLNELKGATSPRLLLEIMCARMVMPGAADGIEALSQRVEALESSQPTASRSASDKDHRVGNTSSSAADGATRAAGNGAAESGTAGSDASATPPRAKGGGRIIWPRKNKKTETSTPQPSPSSETNPETPQEAKGPERQDTGDVKSQETQSTSSGAPETPASPQEDAATPTQDEAAASSQNEAAPSPESVDPRTMDRETLSKYLREQALQQERETRAREAEERMHRIEEKEGPAVVLPESERSADAQNTHADSARSDDTPTADSTATAAANASENSEASAGPETNGHEDQSTDTETNQHDQHADVGAETDQADRDTTGHETGLTADDLRPQWTQIKQAVGKRSKVAQVMVSEAVILGVFRNHVVLGHHTGALAQRLNDQHINTSIVDAITDATGQEVTVEAVIGTDDAALQRWKDAHPDHPRSAVADKSAATATTDTETSDDTSTSADADSGNDSAPGDFAGTTSPASPASPTSILSDSARTALTAAAAWKKAQEQQQSNADETGQGQRDGHAHPRHNATPQSRNGQSRPTHTPPAGRRADSPQEFSDGSPLPPEPDDPDGYGPPPDDYYSALGNTSAGTNGDATETSGGPGNASSNTDKGGSNTGGPTAEAPSSASTEYTQEEAEEEMVNATRDDPNYDHRSAKDIAMELLIKELGAQPL
ncbi:DNA polymerase III subunit gamma and tau [Corynebacterium parakroppenstedtii]|uniref:DNA polymerase III subunit gamma and tau n=1 Tax=Corynebacterium parakroppenstedtii TaxID=2828363 RepID=UPI001C8F2635|nr:DNA polymerase III subunit gamma and tau [Corynebacterium parakroppenstedtii]MBY0795084.1 DNA polymerase III subunit gamma and tau [Corynebacterium parakroppenstedtii]